MVAMSIKAVTDACCVRESIVMGTRNVAELWTENEARSEAGLRGVLADQRQTLARRCSYDGHDGRPSVG